ncbi:MAG: dTDP-4-dehydrorhamnose 3,5-epimerase family protein [Candidatus Atribacteria bacterium]|nr:dTDP-4-dehydrorhamnose 3,5-epimerase family protein [Candidatus Atribacteria bacterium]
MELIKTGFEGLLVVKHNVFEDERGLFVKTYNNQIFEKLGIDLKINERYYSISNKNVIRGMHFQTPPADHIKLVTLISGRILDVVLDLRQNSKTFGKFFSLEIDGPQGKTIYIPKGFAHGFKAMENNTIVEYNQTIGYAPENDAGIHFNSFGFDWQTSNPILSARDLEFINFHKFKSPF